MVEVIVAITLMAIVMVAVAPMLYASLRTATVTSNRSAAAALATRETEALHGIRYADVGFYTNQAGYTATFEGAPTVTLGSVAPAGALATPIGARTLGPVTYSITRHLTWADAVDGTGTTRAQAYKKTTVIITWRDQTGSHNVRQDSIFYPGGQGAYTQQGSASTTTTTTIALAVPGAPTGLVATVPAAPDGESSVDLSWTAPSTGAAVHHYRTETSRDSTFLTGLITGSTTSTSSRVTGLSDNVLYYFRVFAVSTADESGSSPASNTASATTLVSSSSSTCGVRSMVLSRPANGGVKLTASGGLADDIRVTLNLDTSCGTTSFSARSEMATTGVPDPPLSANVNPKAFAPSTSRTRSVEWAAGSTGWSTGDHKIVLTDNAGTPVVPARFVTVRVCSSTAKKCP